MLLLRRQALKDPWMLSGEFTAAKIDGLIAEMGVGKLVVPKGTSPEEWTARRPALPAPAPPPPLWNKTRGNLATVRTFPPACLVCAWAQSWLALDCGCAPTCRCLASLEPRVWCRLQPVTASRLLLLCSALPGQGEGDLRNEGERGRRGRHACGSRRLR